MKRQYRNDMPQQQKDKIAAAQTGKKHSEHTKRLIADKMRKYWAGLPTKPDTDNPNMPTQPKTPTTPQI